MLPAHQRLEAGEPAGTHVELGLVVQDELARVGQRGAQLGDQRETQRAVVVEHPVVDRQPEVRLLGDVHGDVGVLQQRGEVGAVLRGDGDADAGLDVEADPLEDERGRQLGPDTPAEGLGVHGIGDVGEQDHELVAAETGDAVPLAHDPATAAGPISCSSRSPWWWPSVSLISLKRSRSNSRSATRRFVRLGAFDRREGAPAEQLPVRQPGQRIVVGQGRGCGPPAHEGAARPGSPAGRGPARRSRARRAAPSSSASSGAGYCSPPAARARATAAPRAAHRRRSHPARRPAARGRTRWMIACSPGSVAGSALEISRVCVWPGERRGEFLGGVPHGRAS